VSLQDMKALCPEDSGIPVLLDCPCVVSFSKFHEHDTHDLLRTSRWHPRSIFVRHVRHARFPRDMLATSSREDVTRMLRGNCSRGISTSEMDHARASAKHDFRTHARTGYLPWTCARARRRSLSLDIRLRPGGPFVYHSSHLTSPDLISSRPRRVRRDWRTGSGCFTASDSVHRGCE